MKDLIKLLLRYIAYFLCRRMYHLKIFIEDSFIVNAIENLDSESQTFYGYYDHSPENMIGMTLFHLAKTNTGNNSNEVAYIDICCFEKSTNTTIVVDCVKSYNWQMGARAMWISDNIIAYNTFGSQNYICNWYSITEKRIVKTFDIPIQDAYKDVYYLTVNYRRLFSYALDYAYTCLPEMSEDDLNDYMNDGIWHVDCVSNSCSLLHTIEDVLSCDRLLSFENGRHFLNHIMINPDGTAFIFIHRYYIGKQRYDRLMFSDFKEIRVLLSEKCQSHFCWIDSVTVFGYGQYEGKLGFLSIDTVKKTVYCHSYLDTIHPTDGHPSVYNKWIVIDSYPNIKRLQTLILYNCETEKVFKLLEIYHDIRHASETRCDLHPRFSEDGTKIYFDSIYTGKRRLYYININLDKF